MKRATANILQKLYIDVLEKTIEGWNTAPNVAAKDNYFAAIGELLSEIKRVDLATNESKENTNLVF